LFVENLIDSSKNLMNYLSAVEISRIIELAWEGRTPFEAIKDQFGLSEEDVIKRMRNELKPSGFRIWRKRMNGRRTNQRKLRNEKVNRFTSPY
jgi:uncharacterized protein (TIGR03643 family)